MNIYIYRKKKENYKREKERERRESARGKSVRTRILGLYIDIVNSTGSY